MPRPGARNSPCSGRRKRSGIRCAQRIRGASYLRVLTINIPNGNMCHGRSPRPTPGRPAGLRVLAHTHDSLYPSTSSTPSAPYTGRRRSVPSRSTRSVRSGVHYLEVARPQRSRGHSVSHPGRADRRERTSLHFHYPVRMTLPSSYIAIRHRTPAPSRRSGGRYAPPDIANAPNQITLAQGVSCARVTGGVTDGGRTRDLQIHNLALRLLSYSHHGAVRIASQTATTVV